MTRKYQTDEGGLQHGEALSRPESQRALVRDAKDNYARQQATVEVQDAISALRIDLIRIVELVGEHGLRDCADELHVTKAKVEYLYAEAMFRLKRLLS